MRYLFTYGIELLISKQYIDRWIGGQLQIRAKVENKTSLPSHYVCMLLPRQICGNFPLSFLPCSVETTNDGKISISKIDI